MNKIFKCLLSVMTAMVFVVSAQAQFTTSTMTGRVTDNAGEPLVGAAVVAVHTPSGSQYYAVANSEGYYTIAGMRPGGPYEVTVSFVGCTSALFKDVTLALSETYNKDVTLQNAETLSEAVVVADGSKFAAEKTGASTNISNREMMELPNSDRSIAALTKLSPYANGMSFAGGDGRSTNFTVDGANLNNNFGLSSSLPGGGTPISIDALEEVQLVIAPYDVRQSNFIGGGINAVTKSGTNTFKGTAYYYYSDQALRGNKINGKDCGARPLDSENTFGFTLGGPIVKNKLFFFVNFEMLKQKEQAIKYQADAAKQAVLEQIKQKLIKDYNYDPGSYTDFPGGTDNMKILARLDWNISDNHKLSLRYNQTNNGLWQAPNGNSCDDNFRNKSYNRASKESQPFSNNMYKINNNVKSIAAELNSRFGDNATNRFIFTYTDIVDKRSTNSDLFPHIDIMDNLTQEGTIKPYTSLGYELFSYNNAVKNNVFTASDNFTYYAGAHTITAGLSWERQSASNSYMRNATGYYRFASVDDFLNNNLPISAAVTYGYNGEAEPKGKVTYNQWALYVQDEAKLGKNFKLTYGLRADLIAFDNKELMTNNAIARLNFADYSNIRHIDTGKWPTPKVQVSPRIGFNWDITGDKSVVMRGGTGIFQGRLPLVFFTNMPQNAGTIQYSANKGIYSGTPGKDKDMYSAATTMAKLMPGGKLITTVDGMVKALGLPTTMTPESAIAPQSFSSVDPNFKMPQIWKTSLAFDFNLPTSFPFSVTAEGMFNKTINGVVLKDWNIKESVLAGDEYRFTTVDKRINYRVNPDSYHYNIHSNNGKGTNYYYTPYVLSNTNKGYGWSANLTVKMEPAKNLKIMAAYTHLESFELSGMPGSDASSAYSGLYEVNGAVFPELYRSQYVIPDKVIANISYFIPFKVFHGNGLHLDLYYSAYSGARNSYICGSDLNGDGNSSNDLLYIPSSVSDFVWGTMEKNPDTGKDVFVENAAAGEAFMQFVNNDKYLKSCKGGYTQAYAAVSPWVHNIDLRVAEDFAFKIGNTTHNFQLSASIDNLLNMFNSSWGVPKISVYQSSNSGTIAPISYQGIDDATGKMKMAVNKVNGEFPTQNYVNYNYSDYGQCWRILFGIKYFFN